MTDTTLATVIRVQNHTWNLDLATNVWSLYDMTLECINHYWWLTCGDGSQYNCGTESGPAFERATRYAQ